MGDFLWTFTFFSFFHSGSLNNKADVLSRLQSSKEALDRSKLILSDSVQLGAGHTDLEEIDRAANRGKPAPVVQLSCLMPVCSSHFAITGASALP